MTLACVLGAFSLGCGGRVPVPVEVGDAAPSFRLASALEGDRRVTSESLQGKITVLNFWSTNCSVCLKETEDLNRVHDGGKAVVIGIALGDDPVHLRRFVKAQGIKYQVLVGDEDVFSRFEGYAIPYTLVLDRSGKVRRKAYGRIEAKDLAAEIDAIDGTLARAVAERGERRIAALPGS